MRIKIFAPNIHSGGGLVLLQSVLVDWPKDLDLIAWFDLRAKNHLSLPSNCIVTWVRPTIFSRLKAEFTLAHSSAVSEKILFFHGMPPLLCLNSKVIVFLQNRNLISSINYSLFSPRTRIRIFFERIISRMFRHRVDTYIVQTSSMASLLKDWFGSDNIDIRISPFVPVVRNISAAQNKDWDFLYVSDGEAHKNHRTLVEAWKVLGQLGLFPSLALTLSERDRDLNLWIDDQKNSHGLKIINLGTLPHAQIFDLYNTVGALIFPSSSESFGLPLVEANFHKLPILAGELDFVRDVCVPVESFDPNSAVSIARAVSRFLGKSSCTVQLLSPREFVDIVCSIS
jgi:hypothetical protein